MPQSPSSPRTADLLRQLAAIRRSEAECIEKLADEVKHHFAGASALQELLLRRVQPSLVPCDHLMLTPATMTVHWHGVRCVLGPGLSWSLITRLWRTPNCWISYDCLRDDVWADSLVSEDAIKTGVTRLRNRLHDASMGQLANAIRLKKFQCGFFLAGPPD